MIKRQYILFFIILALSIPGKVYTQFYNGHQMTFGKNRVQYNSFYWTYRRYERFDTYFNEYGVQLADYVANFAKQEIPRIESYFDYTLDGRIIFIVYNKLTDFRQSNIGLVTGKTESNVGGVINISNNKVFIYFEGDFEKFEEQIRDGISKIFINQLLYGSDFRTNATNSTLINLPEWYISGLTSYIAKDWNIQTENIVRDNVISGKYKKFNRLSGEDARVAGHSFWRYIGNTYGESVVPNILYMTKVNKNINSGFLYVLGFSLKDLSKDWYAYYSKMYEEFEQRAEFPQDKPILKRPRKHHVYQNIKISPNGKYIAYTTNHQGQYKVWLYNTQTGKKKKIFKKGYKLEQITDYSYPIMAWHPRGRVLAFITEEKGGLRLYYHTFGERKIAQRNLLYFEKVLDFSFSHDGTLMTLSAIKKGQTDIFVHNIAASSNFQVTNDLADDFNPRFINNSKQIIFSSNRISDSLDIASTAVKRAPANELFIYDYEQRSNALMRLSDSEFNYKQSPLQAGSNNFISLQNQNGILNRYHSVFDSTISYVDTAVHYKYFAITNPITNYSRNILSHDYQPSANLLGEIIYNNGRYYMYKREVEDNFEAYTELPNTLFASELRKQYSDKDSINNIVLNIYPLDSIVDNQLVAREDTILFPFQNIDINNYVFEEEKLGLMNEFLKEKKKKIKIVKEIDDRTPKLQIYNEVFFQNYLVSQVDFSFLSESYQAFSGGAVYYNPGMNLAFKLGVQDLFEDLKITGGLRLPLDFESSEYLVSIENLKKQLDWQLIYHRQTFNNTLANEPNVDVKTITNEGYGVLRYPFNQVLSWANTLGFRDDQTVRILDRSNPNNILNSSPTHRYWTTIKTEFIFDNSHPLGLNLHEGNRSKLFAEFYQEINSPHHSLYVFGGDFRQYVAIHRNFIWASRFAFSSSQGNSKLIYYLGGVDNWTNVTPLKTPTFIPLSEIRINEDENYAYQAVATNMRGFSQNIRNGNNFALINTELRFPLVSYFVSYPLSNAFLENFQVVGFFDVGSAWSGLYPWSKKNAYNTDIITASNSDGFTYEIEIDAQRDPIVAGYGFGLRSQLFGYFIRLDWAWGIENQQVLPRVFYFSLSLDF
ncbi:MAG: hypothetical protein MI922_07935 [Bacteroidales bacterium]|nr:hypothetical protein [Bacteroidales bacterium]